MFNKMAKKKKSYVKFSWRKGEALNVLKGEALIFEFIVDSVKFFSIL